MICNRELACSPGSRLKRLGRFDFVNSLPEMKKSDKVQKLAQEASKVTMRAIPKMNSHVKIHGALLRSFLDAGESLKLLLRGDADEMESFEPDTWYPLEVFQKLLRRVSQYKNQESILEQIGIEMMKGWYYHGPGKSLISSGVDFLKFQTSSKGFRSVIKGPPGSIGHFDLLELNEAGGTAGIFSSTVFPREIERGVLLGGLGLAGELLYYDVSNASHADHFDICFVTRQNRTTLSWHHGGVLEEIEWRFKHLENQTTGKEKYWQSINETLNAAYVEMREALSKVKMLTGMLPICASCKKIRDDKGYWNQIEAYIRNHSEADFSHGICPDCAQKLYPDVRKR